MSSFFGEEYKKDLLSKIKEYLNKYEEQLESSGKIEFIARNHNNLKEDLKQANAVKVIKTIGTAWGIIFMTILAFIVYNQVIIPSDINISLFSYICILVGVICAIIGLIIIHSKTIKRIDKISVNSNYLTINLLNSKMQTEDYNPKVYEFDISKMNFSMRRRRENVEHNLRGKTFNIYIKYQNKKVEYILTFEYEEEFFAFILYLHTMLNNIDIKELTNDRLYEMYHTSQYGLDFNK